VVPNGRVETLAFNPIDVDAIATNTMFTGDRGAREPDTARGS